ncbi:MAG: PrgI family protein [Patescibacteria group bacterium]|nr:PrgI family protein [Patescibacteria group bacterium]
MNFQVPQFIEVEDKIFGPLTFKQFAYLAGGGGTCFLIWSLISFKPLAIILMAPIAALALALAFYRINNRSFILVMESALRYFMSGKLFIWRHQAPETNTEAEQADSTKKGVQVPRLSQSKLKDLAWSLDVKETIR